MRTNTQVWNCIPHNKIFWGKPTAELFRHAMYTDGLVCTEGWDNNDVVNKPLVEWLKIVKKKAIHWKAALEKMLNDLPQGEAETILLGIEMNAEQMRDFKNTCPLVVKPLLEACLKTNLRPMVQIAGAQIREDETGWVEVKKKDVSKISDAKLRIDEILEGNDPKCRGRIIYKGEELPFTENLKKLRADPFDWM